MKLVLYNDYQLGVLVGNRVVDAMSARCRTAMCSICRSPNSGRP
jgi:hypothetical protein